MRHQGIYSPICRNPFLQTRSVGFLNVICAHVIPKFFSLVIKESGLIVTVRMGTLDVHRAHQRLLFGL